MGCKHSNIRKSLLLGDQGYQYCPDCKLQFTEKELQQQKEVIKKRKEWGKKLGKMRVLKTEEK